MSSPQTVASKNFEEGVDNNQEVNENRNSTRIDRYGFLEEDYSHHSTLTISEVMMKHRRQKESERSTKWARMLKKEGSSKLKERARKGIPDAVRGESWRWIMEHSYSEYSQVKKRHPNLKVVLGEASSSLKGAESLPTLDARTIDEIDRDIDRTFPKHTMFEEDGGFGQNALRRMLQCYAILDSEVGYCQGMGFIAALFLTYLVEEEAFYCFYATLTRSSSPLRLLYLPRMIETKKVLHVFDKLANQLLGPLWAHLQKEGVHPTMFATEWFMTMFCRGFTFDLVTRVWDIYIAEGSFKIVYRVCLAILKYFEKQFMSLSFEKILAFIKELPPLIDADSLIEFAAGESKDAKG